MDITIKKASYNYLVFLNRSLKPPHKYINPACLDSWVRFYHEYLTPKNNTPFRTKMKKLSLRGILSFIHLLDLIWSDIDASEEGSSLTYFEKFYSKKVSALSIFNMALNMCLNIKSPNFERFKITLDCWLSDSVDEYGYPNVHFKEMEIKWINTQGHRLKVIKDSIDIQIKSHRWICSLLYNIQSSEDQAAHRCGNNNCFNPYHLKLVKDKENKNDLKCRYGCANYCPHTLKCIWTYKGRWVPCRNDPINATTKKDCPHNPNCYELDDYK